MAKEYRLFECVACGATFHGYKDGMAVFCNAENANRPEHLHVSGCPQCGCDDCMEVEPEEDDDGGYGDDLDDLDALDEQTAAVTATLYKEVVIKPCSSGFGEYEPSEANGEGWDDLTALLSEVMQNVEVVPWDELAPDEDIRGHIHRESELVEVIPWRDDAGDLHYIGIVEVQGMEGGN